MVRVLPLLFSDGPLDATVFFVVEEANSTFFAIRFLLANREAQVALGTALFQDFHRLS
jgi:hypothetical protein